jgi:hypothetical protein
VEGESSILCCETGVRWGSSSCRQEAIVGEGSSMAVEISGVCTLGQLGMVDGQCHVVDGVTMWKALVR